jgi:hypothetical protein
MNYGMIPVLLLSLMLIIMLMRIVLPIGAKIAGKTSRELRLSFQERVLLQRINIYAIGMVLLLTIIGGGLSRGWELLVLCAVVLLLLMRVRYIFTNEGIALNNVVYRSWGDFSGYEIRRRGIRLLPQPGLRPFDLNVTGKHREQALALVRAHLHEAPAVPHPTIKPEGKEAKPGLKRFFRRSELRASD